MKKKSNGMSPDMFTDATSSTAIPVFTTSNESNGNESQNLLQKETDNSGVNKFTPVKMQNELIKIDFDSQTVSARALYAFFELEERFSKWFKRMISYGLVENVDFTAVSFVICHKQPDDFTNIPFCTPPVPNGTGGVPFGTGGVPLFTDVNNGVYQDIGDYLLTIEAAKHIAMVQRNEKGKQARQYFIDVEKLYLKKLYSNKPTVETTISLLETLDGIAAQFDNLRSSIALLENGNAQQQLLQKKNDSLVEKTIVLEKTLVELSNFYELKDEYIERTISKKIDMALKTSFKEAEQMNNRQELVNRLSRPTNQKTVIVLNQIEKNLQKTTLEEDLIRKCYRPAERKTENALFLTATEITNRLELLSKRVTIRNVGMGLKKLGFERLHRVINGNQLKGYYVIPLVDLI